ncbi:hypothetical protein AAG906_012228 [Vitis piasezkii]
MRFLLQPLPTSHPSYLFLPSESCTCLFGRPPAIFSQPQSLHVPWEVFFYLSGGATIVFLFHLVSHMGDSSVFPSSAASEAVLGLSSIQIYFILQISGYGY